jgi:phosphatidylinositol glycan class Z
MTLTKWILEGLGYGLPWLTPSVYFYGIRLLMFNLSFVLGDWAIHELIARPHDRRVAIIAVSSSFVTWTFQTHTFSNSIESLVVLWTIVLAIRLRDHRGRISPRSCVVLAFLLVLGVFNRITFPAFVVLPLVQIIPSLWAQPLRIPILVIAGLTTLFFAIAMDTEFYTSEPLHIRQLYNSAVITPWNNLVYNLDETNLAQHGLHPFWQHSVANLPQLIGPALPLVLLSSRKFTLFWSGVIGIAVLSCFRHQEPRFLLPAVPLLLSSIRLPRKNARAWIGAWAVFNVLGGVLFGRYHQGGIIPAQAYIGAEYDGALAGTTDVVWWKTYSPPRWLLGEVNANVTTTDLMGSSGDQMLQHFRGIAPCVGKAAFGKSVLLVAPLSATFLDACLDHSSSSASDIRLKEVWRYRRHIGLDDLDFGDDGVWPTLTRVIGRRGLGIWQVEKRC